MKVDWNNLSEENKNGIGSLVILVLLVLCYFGYKAYDYVGERSNNAKLNSTPVATVTVSKVYKDAETNSLRAVETYSKTVEIIAIFDNAKLEGNEVEIKLVDGHTASVYAKLPKDEYSTVLKFNSGQLISIVCNNFNYNIFARFKSCRNPRLYPLNGDNVEIAYYKLISQEMLAN